MGPLFLPTHPLPPRRQPGPPPPRVPRRCRLGVRSSSPPLQPPLEQHLPRPPLPDPPPPFNLPLTRRSRLDHWRYGRLPPASHHAQDPLVSTSRWTWRLRLHLQLDDSGAQGLRVAPILHLVASGSAGRRRSQLRGTLKTTAVDADVASSRPYSRDRDADQALRFIPLPLHRPRSFRALPASFSSTTPLRPHPLPAKLRAPHQALFGFHPCPRHLSFPPTLFPPFLRVRRFSCPHLRAASPSQDRRRGSVRQ